MREYFQLKTYAHATLKEKSEYLLFSNETITACSFFDDNNPFGDNMLIDF